MNDVNKQNNTDGGNGIKSLYFKKGIKANFQSSFIDLNPNSKRPTKNEQSNSLTNGKLPWAINFYYSTNKLAGKIQQINQIRKQIVSGLNK